MQKPEKLFLANTPTPIQSLKKSGFVPAGVDLYIKRDDYTGVELSGNKIRKLEYIAHNAISNGEELLITCGGVQSNHCRATAVVAARLGLKCHLVLSGSGPDNLGNNALDQIFGAELTYVESKSFSEFQEIMDKIKSDYEARGIKARTITMGASDALGTLGYMSAFEEILDQEKTLGIKFDTICTAVGSAGTYAGLYLGNAVYHAKRHIVGINIFDKSIDYTQAVKDLVQGAADICSYTTEIDMAGITLLEHAYTGYGHTSDQTAEFIRCFAKEQGILLDPVYTGKALHGLSKELMTGHPKLKGNILFIHTGGVFGALARTDEYLK